MYWFFPNDRYILQIHVAASNASNRKSVNWTLPDNRLVVAVSNAALNLFRCVVAMGKLIPTSAAFVKKLADLGCLWGKFIAVLAVPVRQSYKHRIVLFFKYLYINKRSNDLPRWTSHKLVVLYANVIPANHGTNVQLWNIQFHEQWVWKSSQMNGFDNSPLVKFWKNLHELMSCLFYASCIVTANL